MMHQGDLFCDREIAALVKNEAALVSAVDALPDTVTVTAYDIKKAFGLSAMTVNRLRESGAFVYFDMSSGDSARRYRYDKVSFVAFLKARLNRGC